LHPLIRAIGRECAYSLIYLAVYAAMLAILAFGGMQVYAALPANPTPQPEAPKTEWTEIARPHPVFGVEVGDFLTSQPSMLARRHAEGGGRRDLLLWQGADPRLPRLAIEVYRPGSEERESAEATPGGRTTNAPEELPSKFGPFVLSPSPGSAGSAEKMRCLHFERNFEEPVLQISGLACDRAPPAKLKELIACSLDRLGLISAGGDAKLAGLFARAELKRSACAPGRLPTAALPHPGAWIDAAGGPALRK
jgi:hypothetical protein